MEPTSEKLFEDKTAEKLGLTHIDRYEIIEQIGIGAMGVVYRVHDPVFSCDRALKILRPELVGEADTVQRFRDEGRAAVRAAGEISHPNIVTVYDAGEFSSRPYIVMELFRGVPLNALLDKERGFSIAKTLSIGEQLAGALASAHKHDVVHRDIKPGNVLLSEDGKLAKLTDFSVAQVRKGADSSLTRTGVVIGAPRYMPPEQALGKEVDGRSDLYGLGIMLYEMLTGEKAYKSDTFTALLIEISQSQLRPIRSLNKEVTPGLERIISKLVEKDPARRFQTGSELQEAIRREMRNMNAKDLRASRGIPTEIMAAALLSVLVAGLLGLAGYLLKKQQAEALEKQTAAIGLEYASVLANQFSLDYARSGEDAGLLYQSQFNQIDKNENINYQSIVLNDGRILASTDTENSTGQYAEPEIVKPIGLGSENEVTNIVKPEAGEDRIQVSKAIEIGPTRDRRAIGTLHVGLPIDRIKAIGKLTTSLMLLLTLLMTSLVGIVSYYLIRKFARPMEKLRDQLNLISTGDYDVRMPGNHKGLVGETYVAFNKAAETITAIPAAIPLRPTEQWAGVVETPAEYIKQDEASEEETEPFEIEIPEKLSASVMAADVSDKTVILPLQDDDDYDAIMAASAPVLKPEPVIAPTPKSSSIKKPAPKKAEKPKAQQAAKTTSKKTASKKSKPVTKKPVTKKPAAAKSKTAAKPKAAAKPKSSKAAKVKSAPTKTRANKSTPAKAKNPVAQKVDGRASAHKSKKQNPDSVPVDDKTRVFRIDDDF